MTCTMFEQLERATQYWGKRSNTGGLTPRVSMIVPKECYTLRKVLTAARLVTGWHKVCARELCVSCRGWGPLRDTKKVFQRALDRLGSWLCNFSWKPRIFTFYQYHLFSGGFTKFRAATKELKYLIRLIKHISQLDQIIWIFPLEWIYLIKGNAYLLVAPPKCFSFFLYSPWSKVKDFSIQQQCKNFT